MQLLSYVLLAFDEHGEQKTLRNRWCVKMWNHHLRLFDFNIILCGLAIALKIHYVTLSIFLF